MKLNMIINEEKRELRVLSRNFSLGEYGESWTKLERYLFIEIYNVIKDFYLSRSSENIKTFSSESMVLTLPIDKLDSKLFRVNQKKRDLLTAAKGLSKKQISTISIENDGQYGFDFISIFPRITYTPSKDKKNMYVQIQSEVYEKMVPIESYCQLDLKLISEFNSGNTVRLYEIFKSYSFRNKFEISFDELRKKLGFFNEGSYQEWKYFNAKVLKPAVIDINNHKQYDIEVFYEKPRGLDSVSFNVKTHKKQKKISVQTLNLNEPICLKDRKLNLIQQKYVETVINACKKEVKISNTNEVFEWIVIDLVSQQKKQGNEFCFKHSMNAISKQLRKEKYTKPYSYKHLVQEAAFDHLIYDDIKVMVDAGRLKDVKEKYSNEEIKANNHAFILSATS